MGRFVFPEVSLLKKIAWSPTSGNNEVIDLPSGHLRKLIFYFTGYVTYTTTMPSAAPMEDLGAVRLINGYSMKGAITPDLQPNINGRHILLENTRMSRGNPPRNILTNAASLVSGTPVGLEFLLELPFYKEGSVIPKLPKSAFHLDCSAERPSITISLAKLTDIYTGGNNTAASGTLSIYAEYVNEPGLGLIKQLLTKSDMGKTVGTGYEVTLLTHRADRALEGLILEARNSSSKVGEFNLGEITLTGMGQDDTGGSVIRDLLKGLDADIFGLDYFYNETGKMLTYGKHIFGFDYDPLFPFMTLNWMESLKLKYNIIIATSDLEVVMSIVRSAVYARASMEALASGDGNVSFPVRVR